MAANLVHPTAALMAVRMVVVKARDLAGSLVARRVVR